MKRAKAAVVIDSFPSHLAGALGTPVVVLYGPAPARVVGPKGDPNKIINLEPNKLDVCKSLTNCWGTDKTCTSSCINTISPLLVKKALKSLLGEV
jgi:ADP-heptose:LPS heptosyltransferase